MNYLAKLKEWKSVESTWRRDGEQNIQMRDCSGELLFSTIEELRNLLKEKFGFDGYINITDNERNKLVAHWTSLKMNGQGCPSNKDIEDWEMEMIGLYENVIRIEVYGVVDCWERFNYSLD